MDLNVIFFCGALSIKTCHLKNVFSKDVLITEDLLETILSEVTIIQSKLLFWSNVAQQEKCVNTGKRRMC